MTEAGMLARSTAGHDRGVLYAILSVCGEYVYLVNGAERTIARPKKKNQKHIQVIHVSCDTMADDTGIRRFLKQFEAGQA